jgi:acylphosphatase
MKIIRVRVRGRVQGVFFRQSTREVAKRAGVIGYTRNMADASVEIVATGSDEALSILLDFVGRGPERARVDDLEVAEISLEHLPQSDRLVFVEQHLPDKLFDIWPDG